MGHMVGKQWKRLSEVMEGGWLVFRVRVTWEGLKDEHYTHFTGKTWTLT